MDSTAGDESGASATGDSLADRDPATGLDSLAADSIVIVDSVATVGGAASDSVVAPDSTPAGTTPPSAPSAPESDSTSAGSETPPIPAPGALWPPGAWPGQRARPAHDLGQGDDFFGRLTARGSYEIRSLATDIVLGHEDWELFEDDAGFRTLRATTELEVDGARSSRTASVTVTPELTFVEGDLGSNAAGIESYATYRRTGDLLSVEAYGDANGEARQQVRLPEDGVFVSQVFATRGWELASFDRSGESTHPAYLAGSAPGVLIGEIKTLSARRGGQEDLRLRAGLFRALRFEIPPTAAAAGEPRPGGGGGEDEMLDRWWVLAGSRIPVAADLPSLGVRVELAALIQDPAPAGAAERGIVLARGIYHHRLLRRTEPLAVESWALSAEPDGGYLLDSEVTYADGQRVDVRARADSAFHVLELRVRRIAGRGGESTSITVEAGQLLGESRGGAVGLAQQRLSLRGPVVFRLGAAALEGWAIVAAGGAGAGQVPEAGAGAAGATEGDGTTGHPAPGAGPELPAGGDGDPHPPVPGDTLQSATTARQIATYWLPAGAHPLGTLLNLPADVDLGTDRIPTPARTFSTRRYASPAETPSLFRTVRWVFDPYRLPARVLFPTLGREAILVRYETPD